MATDHEGNSLSVGDNIWIPLKITNISSGGIITGTTGYSSTTVSGTPAGDTHKNKPTSFPDLP